nr:serine/threonine-protein kinase EDR1-like isoform X1 [Ipomoea batatas]
MLCQMKSKPCHYQAILFKVLADTVGLECKLIVGLPREGVIKRDDSYEHICVTVVLNSVEFLVDLVRSPGKLIPYASQALILPHIRASRDIYSGESDSYSSPIEPNSPICLVSDQLGIEGISSEESIRPSYQHKLEASTNVSIPSLRNINSSQTEPFVADSFWWHNRKKIISEQPSPEHPLFRAHRRSVLGDQRYSAKGYSDDTSASRSAGASPIETRRRRRRCVSMIPEISDNIVRAVRAMNEAAKQNRLPREQEGLTLDSDDQASALRFHRDYHDEDSGRSSQAYDFQRMQINSHKAISLPSSPQYKKNQVPGMADGSGVLKNPDIISRFDKVLESSKLVNKPLLPYEEWNIDFSEINIGIRVGIGFFGEVFRGIWNGIEVAVKVYLEQDLSTENIEDFANEISLLR